MTSDFTPVSALLGGAMLRLGASALLLFHGRIAGISGIVGGLLRPAKGDVSWRVSFVAGVLLGGLVLTVVAPELVRIGEPRTAAGTAAAGLLVGFGSRLGSGCTSGHGVCGIGRLSARSLVATGTFMAVAFATVFILRHVLGARP